MNKEPTPRAIERAMSLAMQLREMLKTESGELDEQLFADTIEGETDVMELLDRIIEWSIADRLLADTAKTRAKRLETRAEKARDLAQRMLEELGLDRLERATYTASIAAGPPSVVIEDPDEVPPAYLRTVPDKERIKRVLKAGEPVPGALLSNERPVLRILTR